MIERVRYTIATLKEATKKLNRAIPNLVLRKSFLDTKCQPAFKTVFIFCTHIHNHSHTFEHTAYIYKGEYV